MAPLHTNDKLHTYFNADIIDNLLLEYLCEITLFISVITENEENL